MTRDFQGKIELDVRDSVSDWDASLPPTAPEGAPNVLLVLYDDTGQAAWSPYGGRIQMTTMERLAQTGLTYTANQPISLGNGETVTLAGATESP